MFKRSEIELMAPAGSYASLTAAIEAGADAVYFGVEGLNMRARSSANFTLDDLARIVETTRRHGVKSYLTLNTIIYDDDLPVMREVIDCAVREGIDAVIASDMAAILYAREAGIEVHISTQLNLCNIEAVRYYAQWADVVVLARELSLEQVAHIHAAIMEEEIRGPRGELIKIEMFVHGALCMAVSGKCYLSAHLAGCSANRGACQQICRRSYELRDRETGEEILVENQYLLSPKDLCTITFLDRMFGAGVRVLKIEGRARAPEYVKRVCETYNEAIDALLDGTYSPARFEAWLARLATVFNRGFWEGYYLGAPVVELNTEYGSAATRRKVYVGKVTNYFKKVGVAEITTEASGLDEGDEILILGETTGVVEACAENLRVEERPVTRVARTEVCSLKLPAPVRRGDQLYKLIKASDHPSQLFHRP